MEKTGGGSREKANNRPKSYDYYKRGRDLAWETLIKCGISSLPVDLGRVAEVCGIRIVSFRRAEREGLIDRRRLRGSLVTDIVGGQKTVFVDNTMGDGAVRMNMAKGIGRYLLSENPGRASRRTYYEAAVFARDLLMPAIALFVLDIRDAAEIERICSVPPKAALARAERMAELRRRGKFNSHPLERKAGELFLRGSK